MLPAVTVLDAKRGPRGNTYVLHALQVYKKELSGAG